MTLVNLPRQSERTITGLRGEKVLVARLMELGFVRGETVRFLGCAPFGEPFLVEIRGATVALRKEEAECVLL
jgi:ferrous iron transport protein A